MSTLQEILTVVGLSVVTSGRVVAMVTVTWPVLLEERTDNVLEERDWEGEGARGVVVDIADLEGVVKLSDVCNVKDCVLLFAWENVLELCAVLLLEETVKIVELKLLEEVVKTEELILLDEVVKTVELILLDEVKIVLLAEVKIVELANKMSAVPSGPATVLLPVELAEIEELGVRTTLPRIVEFAEKMFTVELGPIVLTTGVLSKLTELEIVWDVKRVTSSEIELDVRETDTKLDDEVLLGTITNVCVSLLNCVDVGWIEGREDEVNLEVTAWEVDWTLEEVVGCTARGVDVMGTVGMAMVVCPVSSADKEEGEIVRINNILIFYSYQQTLVCSH